jgi:hypothetical protein
MDDAEAEAEERAERAAAVAEELAADWAARSPGDAGAVRALAPELASVIEALLEVTERDVPPHESEALLTLLGRRALLDGVGATALHRLAPLLATRLEVDAAPLGEVLFEGYAAAISEREARATGARMAETLQVLTPLEGVRLALIGGLQRPEPLEAHAEGLADLLLEGKVRVLWVHVGGLRTHRDGWSQVLGLADACRALDVEVLYSGLVPEVLVEAGVPERILERVDHRTFGEALEEAVRRAGWELRRSAFKRIQRLLGG